MAAVVAVAAGLAVIPAAPAKDGDVIKRASCTARADWKLKLSQEDGRIEVEFEVDQNVSGRNWRVRLFRDGTKFFDGIRATRPPSGSFEVRRVISNSPGTDTVVATAQNLRSGERCRGSITAGF